MNSANLKALILTAACLLGAGFVFGADSKGNPTPAAAAVEGMFPGGISRCLERFGEPALGTRFDGVRITRLQPGGLHCIRIWRPPTALYKPPQKPILSEPRMLLKHGGFDHPDPKGIALPVSAADINRLLETFRSEELFNLSSRDETGIRGGALDAAVWIFERWDYDHYRVIAREGPKAGPVKRCADAVLEVLERLQPRE